MKLMAWSLIIVALLVVLGMVLGIDKLWFVVDVLVIVVCGVSGVVLLKK